jgi:hypothetical protein
MAAEFRTVPVVDASSADAWRNARQNAPGPYILRGVAIDHLAHWTRDYLTSTAGHRQVPVEYSVRGITRLDLRLNAAHHMRRSMSFADALQAIERTPTRGVTHYISSLEISRWLPELADDVRVPLALQHERYLGSYFFAGGDGTGSTLHYDPTDNYMVMLQGEKQVLLLPPGRLREMRVTPVWQPYSGVSRMDPRAVEAYIRRRRRDVWHCTARSGDVMYLPQNWWHQVRNRGLTLGVSLSFQWSKRSLLHWRQARLHLRLEIERWLSVHPAVAARIDRYLESYGWWQARRKPRSTSGDRTIPPPSARHADSPRSRRA